MYHVLHLEKMVWLENMKMYVLNDVPSKIINSSQCKEYNSGQLLSKTRLLYY